MNDAVVVGYDQSRSGDHTLEEAARTADLRKAPLVVLNACPPPIPAGAALPVPATSSWSPTDLVDSANRMVGLGVTLARSWHPTLAIEGRVVAGRAWEVLGEASREAALLVVGGHGASGIAEAVPGPVTPRVVADSECPVLVVPAVRCAERGPVVAAVDIDEPCEEVLDFAFAEARWRGAVLEVVHVWEEPWNLNHLRHTSGLGNDVALIEDELRLRLAEALRRAGDRHPGVEPAGRIEAGSAARSLIRASRSAELIVAGARRWGRRRRHRQWIGPVVQALLHHAECPVAVVPQDRAPETGPTALSPG